ncbi:uncharacterized protein LDX57_007320 [Aspergillus melleus]|uniref:uncharacterized protein n=1 Tax=Aspergillus melleus TaxID=138277 RepID=UPI001E8D5E73|nr:uncharacterized protein LDX57_007320 [Aspergillus melleus]KAH8429648.1 hypothetical protein LDX57_007320 [Aspergillus melleus]
MDAILHQPVYSQLPYEGIMNGEILRLLEGGSGGPSYCAGLVMTPTHSLTCQDVNPYIKNSPSPPFRGAMSVSRKGQTQELTRKGTAFKIMLSDRLAWTYWEL